MIHLSEIFLTILFSILNMLMYNPLKGFKNILNILTLRMLKANGFQCFVMQFVILFNHQEGRIFIYLFMNVCMYVVLQKQR